MAICDARYVFTHIDIGSYGSNNVSGVFKNSKMGEQFFENKVHIPEADSLEGSSISEKVPYYLVGDEAFPLQSWLLRPYPGQGIPEEQVIFDYRLSRARRVIENAFGILSARWRIFMRPIQSSVDSTQMIVRAAVVLHNFLRQTNSAGYCPGGFIDSYDSTGKLKEGEWRRIVPNGPTKKAVEVREEIKTYVNSMEGSLPWPPLYEISETQYKLLKGL